jgi:DNA-binding HxlR family transcriptional regulator
MFLIVSKNQKSQRKDIYEPPFEMVNVYKRNCIEDKALDIISSQINMIIIDRLATEENGISYNEVMQGILTSKTVTSSTYDVPKLTNFYLDNLLYRKIIEIDATERYKLTDTGKEVYRKIKDAKLGKIGKLLRTIST